MGLALQPLADRLQAQLLVPPVLHADEIPVALLDPKASKTRRADSFADANARREGADPHGWCFSFKPAAAVPMPALSSMTARGR